MSKKKRLYQFVPDQHGLTNIMNRRLKVSFPDQVNDLYEMMPFDFGKGTQGRSLRQRWKSSIKRHAKTSGFLSFSESWNNPTMWAHYATNHQGVCLGFDVPEGTSESCGPTKICYVDQLIVLDPSKLKLNTSDLDDTFDYAMKTKSRHWEYEQEWRIFAKLSKAEIKEKEATPSKLFFLDFGDQLVLKEIIFGHHSTLTTNGLKRLLETKDQVAFSTARPSFQEFKMVSQKNSDYQK